MSTHVIVIGSGFDELVAARQLLREGCSVVVLGTGESAREGWIPPALGIEGVAYEFPDPWVVAPLPQGGRLELWRDMARSIEAIARVSPRDAQAWPQFCERMSAAARLLEPLYTALPLDPLGQDRLPMLRFAFRAHRAGRPAIEDLLRLVPMPIADVLDDWFENDTLKGVLAAEAVRDSRYGPRAGGTAFAFLHHHAGNAPGVFRRARLRPMPESPGLEIRKAAEPDRILIDNGRVRGIALKSGKEIAASVVLSGAGPQRTLLELLEPGWLAVELVRAVRNIRTRRAAVRVKLELNRAPGFETLTVAPSLDYLERASDDAKHGNISREPRLEVCKQGASTLDIHLQYVPEGSASGLAAKTLLKHCPELAGAIVGEEVWAPLELRAELALDQALWMRPVPALARYRTPLEGLFLCGPDMHPGPRILGASGYLCAREVLRHFNRRTPA